MIFGAQTNSDSQAAGLGTSTDNTLACWVQWRRSGLVMWPNHFSVRIQCPSGGKLWI